MSTLDTLDALGAPDSLGGAALAGSPTLGAVTRTWLARSGANTPRQAPKPKINTEHSKITASPFRITLCARVTKSTRPVS